MSIFNKTNFERQGNTENDIHLSTTEDVRESITALSASALRSIKIFTPNLEPQLYDNDGLREKLLAFIRGNRHAQINILVEDTTLATRNGHQLLRLAQQVTSSVQIRQMPEEYQHTDMSFLIIDQSCFIYKPNTHEQMAIQSECKHRANKLDDFFSLTWEQSEVDPASQSFRI